jgi:hypothetical protein
MSDYDKEITILIANESSATTRINRTQVEKDALSEITGQGEEKSMNEDLRQRI